MSLARSKRWIGIIVLAAAAATLAGVSVTAGGADAADRATSISAPQSYDLTGAPYCTATTGLATAALNNNLVSNPGGEFATKRGAVPGGAGTASGSTVPDPDGVLLPDCWAVTSTIAGSDPMNEIASVVSASYPGTNGKQNFYGGKSANDKAPAGTTTTATQTIDLTPLGTVDGQPFVLSATLGGYANQDDNTVLSATWQDADGNRLGSATVGPNLSADRDDTSMEMPAATTGSVPAGATTVVVTLTFTHSGAGNNDASADSVNLTIGPNPVSARETTYTTATCPAADQPAPAVNTNLIANAGGEDYATVNSKVVPACWTGHVGALSGGVVPVDNTDTRTGAPRYPRINDTVATGGTADNGGARVFYGGTGMTAGSINTFTQSVDLSTLSPAGQSFRFAGWLGGYQGQADVAGATVTFQDANGTATGSAKLGPINVAARQAVNASDPTGLLPVWTFGTVPAGTTKALVTLSFYAAGSGNSDGMADDMSLVIGGDNAKPGPQRYDATGSSCPSADRVTPALDANLISNPGAEDYTSAVWFGAPGDDSVTVPSCWVSSSDLPAPEAVAESYAQSSSAYPPVRDSARVFWGGTNPDGGIAGVTTKATQTIDLTGLGGIAGTSFKLSGLLGGYSTQNDYAVVSATFQDADGKTLDIASLGPVKAAQRNSVSSLVPQAWYGTVPAGAAKVVVTVAMTAVSSGNDLNGEADDLNLTIGASTEPSGPILQTLPYDASAGDDERIDPTTGLALPPAGGLYRPAGLAAADGTVYVSNTGDNVLAALHNGQSTSLAGNLSDHGLEGDGGKAADALLYQPGGVAVGSDGTLYVADSGDNVVRRITPDGLITRVAGTGVAGRGVVGPDVRATATQLNRPSAVALDPDGNLFIADTFNSRVLKLNRDGSIVSAAGSGRPGFRGDGYPATAAWLNLPTGIAFDAKGNLFIADSANNVIRRVDAATARISTVAGNYAADQRSDGLGDFSGDGGPATAAQLNDPQGVAVDGAGNLYIADTFNNAVRRVTPDGTISTIVNHAGPNGAIPAAGGESSGEAPAVSKLDTPHAVAIDPATNVLYIADTKNSAIAEVLDVAQPGSSAATGGKTK